MLDMSNAAYCNLEMIQQWDCGPCKTQQAPGGPAGYHAPSVFEGLVDGYGKVQRFGTQAFVAMLPAVGPNNTAAIVVSFRGSSDTLNWLLDFQFLKMVPYGELCPTCRVHEGFYKSWLSLAGRLVAAVRALHFAYVKCRGTGRIKDAEEECVCVCVCACVCVCEGNALTRWSWTRTRGGRGYLEVYFSLVSIVNVCSNVCTAPALFPASTLLSAPRPPLQPPRRPHLRDRPFTRGSHGGPRSGTPSDDGKSPRLPRVRLK